MMMLSPLMTSTPALFCGLLLTISTHSPITRFIKGAKPCGIPYPCWPPFNFNDNLWFINFFSWGGWALLMTTLQQARRDGKGAGAHIPDDFIYNFNIKAIVSFTCEESITFFCLFIYSYLIQDSLATVSLPSIPLYSHTTFFPL